MGYPLFFFHPLSILSWCALILADSPPLPKALIFWVKFQTPLPTFLFDNRSLLLVVARNFLIVRHYPECRSTTQCGFQVLIPPLPFLYGKSPPLGTSRAVKPRALRRPRGQLQSEFRIRTPLEAQSPVDGTRKAPGLPYVNCRPDYKSFPRFLRRRLILPSAPLSGHPLLTGMPPDHLFILF